MFNIIAIFEAADIVAWIMGARGIFMLVAAFLLSREPMLCGGRNRDFHYLLAIIISYSGINGLLRSILRTTQIISAGGFLHADFLILTETIYLLLAFILVGKLGYDFYQYQVFLNIKHHFSKCEQCQYKTDILLEKEVETRPGNTGKIKITR